MTAAATSQFLPPQANESFDFLDFEDWLIVERPMKPATADKRISYVRHMARTWGFDVASFAASREGAERQTRRIISRLKRREGISNTAIGQYVRALNCLGAYCGYKDFHVKAPAPEEAERRALTPDEFAAVRAFRHPGNAYLELQIRALIHAGFTLGARPGELVKVRRQDLDPVNSRVFLAFPEKGSWKRWLPVEREFWAPTRPFGAWLKHLEGGDYPDPDGLWWTAPYNGKRSPVTADRLRNWYNKHVKPRTGVDVKPYSFRHTRAVALFRAGLDILFIKEFLGHRKLETTYHYLRSLVSDLSNAFKALELPGYFAGPKMEKP